MEAGVTNMQVQECTVCSYPYQHSTLSLSFIVCRGLAAMGTSVSIVSTGNPQIDDYRVESLDPAVGEMEVAFCSHVGEFDALVDTISDEANLAESSMIDDDDEFAFRSGIYSGVLTLLKSRHKCHRYVSTMTASQRIVRDGGVLFGPGQAKDHIKRISNDKDVPHIVPPKGFGTTVETLLKDGITYVWKYDGNTIVRAWSLPEFWELASWPRDAAGGSNIRFGFPVVDDLDMLDDEDNDDEEEEESAAIPKGDNPFIMEIDGVSSLSQDILNNDEKDSVLFLSANYCRTCKAIAPAYTRFARLNQADDVMFAKADTSGKAGKELGQLLNVNAVPLFVFFRKGERFGTPLSINKLPSKKLDLALEFLTSGAKWDSAALEKIKEKKENRSS
jgi:thiol-disulfide isomerase/thioredoxin